MREILVLKSNGTTSKMDEKDAQMPQKKKKQMLGKMSIQKKKRKPYNRKLSPTLSLRMILQRKWSWKNFPSWPPKDVSHHRCKTPNTRQFRRQLSSKWPLLFIKWLILLVCYLLRVASIPIPFHICLYLEIVVDSLIATRALLFCKKNVRHFAKLLPISSKNLQTISPVRQLVT